MKKTAKALLFSLSTIGLFSCATNVVEPTTPEKVAELQVVTWNVEHLAYPIDTGCKPRTPEEITQLQAYANSLNADIVALQEVDSLEAVSLLFPSEQWQIVMLSLIHI